MPIQIHSNTFPETSYLESCSPLLNPCDIVSDLYRKEYIDQYRTAIFSYSFPRHSLYSLYSPSWQQYGISELLGEPNPYLGKREGNRIEVNVAIPGSNGETVGVRVYSRELPPGTGRSYSTQLVFESDEDGGEWFLVTQEMVEATMGEGASFIPGTYDQRRIVLPPNLAHLVSDNEHFGCGKNCCGEGWRIWYIEKEGCEPEVVWVRATPPDSYQGDRSLFGPQYNDPTDPTVVTGYGVYMARGMGKQPKPGSNSIEANNFGTPNIICPGDRIVVGPLITTSKDGCLVCDKPYRKVTTRFDYTNYTQRMHGTALCVSVDDLYAPQTLHGTNEVLQNSLRQALKKIHHQIGYTLEFGQQTLGAGLHDLDDSLHPGVGSSGLEKIPYTTDGWITQILKNAKANLHTIYITEDDCHNPCLLPTIDEIISAKLAGLPERPLIAFGSDFLIHLEKTRIQNMYAANINSLEEAERLDRMRYSGWTVLDVNNQLQNQGAQFTMLRIGSRIIPFMKHMDLMMREPGMIIIMPVDAPRIVTPSFNPSLRNSSLGSLFLPPTAVPGLPIPTFYDNTRYTNVLNGNNRGGQFLADNNCPIEINWYIDIGADFDPTAYPYTFILDFKGVKRDGRVVSVRELDGCSGCFQSLLNVYEALRGTGTAYVNNMARPLL